MFYSTAFRWCVMALWGKFLVALHSIYRPRPTATIYRIEFEIINCTCNYKKQFN